MGDKLKKDVVMSDIDRKLDARGQFEREQSLPQALP
jgi:hypothetical protein